MGGASAVSGILYRPSGGTQLSVVQGPFVYGRLYNRGRDRPSRARPGGEPKCVDPCEVIVLQLERDVPDAFEHVEGKERERVVK